MDQSSAQAILDDAKARGVDGIQALTAEANGAISGTQTIRLSPRVEVVLFSVPGRTALDVYAKCKNRYASPTSPTLVAGAIVRVYSVVQGQDFLLGSVVFGGNQRTFEGLVARARCGASQIKVTIEAAESADDLRREEVTVSVYAYGTDPQPTEFVDLTAGDRTNTTGSSLAATASFMRQLLDTQVDGFEMVSADSVRQVFGTNNGPLGAHVLVLEGDNENYNVAVKHVRAVCYVDTFQNFCFDFREVNAVQQSRKDGLTPRASGRFFFVSVTTDLHLVDGGQTFEWLPYTDNGFYITTEVR